MAEARTCGRKKITASAWRTEAISDCVRIVTGERRKKIILARLSPKQLPELETHANAELMAMAPELALALVGLVRSGVLSGESHPLVCSCGSCVIRRIANKAGDLL